MARSGHKADQALREARIAETSEVLASAVERLVTSQDWIAAMRVQARFSSRSFSNVMLIVEQHRQAFAAGRIKAPEPTYVAGYRQWQQLGRQVDKGQKGYAIFAPVTRRFAQEGDGPGAARQLGRGETPQAGEAVQKRMVAVKVTHVWDVSQTSGQPLAVPPRPQLLAGQAPVGLIDRLVDAVVGRGFEFRAVAGAGEIGGANGMTRFLERVVLVRANMDEAARAKTLAHELGHIVLHDPTTAPSGEGESGRCRGVREVEAESIALLVCDAAGLDTVAYTVPYVSSWAAATDGADPAAIVRATGERVRKAAGSLITEIGLADQSATSRAVPDRLPAGPGRAGRALAAASPAPEPVAVPTPSVPGWEMGRAL